MWHATLEPLLYQLEQHLRDLVSLRWNELGKEARTHLVRVGDQRALRPEEVPYGADDPLVPAANARILAALIPDSRLVPIDDRHLFLVTSAAESARLAADFLD